MKIAISKIGENEREVRDVKNIVEEIENAYWSGDASELRFYKKSFGSYSIVAYINLICPHEICLYKERLTETEIKKFISIIPKHLSQFSEPFTLTWGGKK